MGHHQPSERSGGPLQGCTVIHFGAAAETTRREADLPRATIDDPDGHLRRRYGRHVAGLLGTGDLL